MNYSDQEQTDARSKHSRSFHESIISSSPHKNQSSLPDHESALQVNNHLTSSLTNSALLQNLMRTQNFSQTSGQAMMQSTQQQQDTTSHFVASKRKNDFSAPTTQIVQLPQDYSSGKNYIINLKDHEESTESEQNTLAGEQIHDEKTFNISRLHSQNSSNMLDEMKIHHKSLEMKSSAKFVKSITEGSCTAHDMLNQSVSCFVNEFKILEAPVENDLKEYDLYAWGLNDNHQLGQLEISPRDRQVIIPRKVKDEFQIQDIKCSQSHSLILTKSGQVFVLGNNSNGQLGLNVQQDSVISFPKEIGIEKVAQVATSGTHSLLLTKDGKLWATGLNEKGQLGTQNLSRGQVIFDRFTQVTVLNNLFERQMTIHKIFCMEKASGVVFQDNQIWVWGSLGDEQLVKQIKTPYNCQISDIQFGSSSILLLTKSGSIFQSDELLTFNQIPGLSSVKEIAAFDEYFACLDTHNNIHHWSSPSGEISKLEKDMVHNLHFCKLSIGQDFGHVTDQYGNLHGWGNNKNGELGTGDSYPRKKLTQVRIFSSSKQYMRCKTVYSGKHFTFGLFESNNMLPSVNTSVKKSSTVESYPKSTIQRERRGSLEEQYQDTQKAIQKYRDHARDYKQNVELARSEDYYLLRPSRGSVRNTLRTSNGELVTREARSISPYNKTLSTLTEAKYSPDINVVATHKMTNTYNNGSHHHLLSKSVDNYSFSQLNYKFDENKKELLNFKNKLPEIISDKKSIDKNVHSVGTEGIRDFEKRIGSFGYPPTVTSIEQDPLPVNRRNINPSYNRRGENLNSVIKTQINRTSEILNRSSGSRSHSHDVVYQDPQATNFSNFIKQNTVFDYRAHRFQQDRNNEAFQSNLSVTHIPENTRNHHQIETFADQNTFELLSNSKSTIEPSIMKTGFLNRDSGVNSNSRHSNTFLAPQSSNREIIHKINKYKRKIKKYMNSNTDLQRQLEMQVQHNQHLQKQNDRLLKTDKLENNLKDQINMLETQLGEMKNGYEEILNEKDCQIEELTQENMHMLNEIQERDNAHQTLEDKLEYVDNEICKLAKQLEHSNKVNAKLKEDVKKARARDKIVHELEKRLDEQKNNEIKEMEALRHALDQKHLETVQQKSEIEFLKQQKSMTTKENDILAITLADLREKLVVLERNQEMRQKDKKTYDNMQKYQDQIAGLLSGTKSSTNINNNNSWIQKHGPLIMNYNYDDHPTKRTDNSGTGRDHQATDLQNALSFQPSLQKLQQYLQYEVEKNKGEQYCISDISERRSDLPTFEVKQGFPSQSSLEQMTQRQLSLNPTFQSSNNATSAAQVPQIINYDMQEYQKPHDMQEFQNALRNMNQPSNEGTFNVNSPQEINTRNSRNQIIIQPQRSRSGPQKMMEEPVAENQQQARQMNTIIDERAQSPLFKENPKVFQSFYQPPLPAESFPNYNYVKERYLNGSKSPIKKQPAHQDVHIQKFKPSPRRDSTPSQILSNIDESPFMQRSYEPKFTNFQPSQMTNYQMPPSKLTDYPQSPISQPNHLSINQSLLNRPLSPARQSSPPRLTSVSPPLRSTHTTFSPPCDEKKLQKLEMVDQKSKYINSILSKFEKRTTNKVMSNMRGRDLETKSQEPILSSRNKFSQERVAPIEPKQSYGEIRSLDRINQQNEKKTSIDDFKERTKEWYLRRGRKAQEEVSHRDMSQKYKDAFKNLSMELKKKIDMEYRTSIDDKYLQVSSAGTDVRKITPAVVAEDQYFSLN